MVDDMLTEAACALEAALDDGDLVEGDRADLASRLAQIQHIATTVRSLNVKVAKFLGELMENADEHCGDWLAHRKWNIPGGWEMDAVRRSVEPLIVDRVAPVNTDTGEVDPLLRAAAVATYHLAMETWSVTPKVGGLRKLGLKPDLYRRNRAGEGQWQVWVEPAYMQGEAA